MMEEKILIDNGIDVAAGIELLGDKATYKEMLESFISESSTRMPNIQKYKELGDMQNYAILVHAMKGDSKYLGFTNLAELSLQHEMESKANNISYINDHYDELIIEANRIITLIKQYLGKER